MFLLVSKNCTDDSLHFTWYYIRYDSTWYLLKGFNNNSNVLYYLWQNSSHRLSHIPALWIMACIINHVTSFFRLATLLLVPRSPWHRAWQRGARHQCCPSPSLREPWRAEQQSGPGTPGGKQFSTSLRATGTEKGRRNNTPWSTGMVGYPLGEIQTKFMQVRW